MSASTAKVVLVARDFARNRGTPTVRRILDNARSGSDRSARGAPTSHSWNGPPRPASW